MAALAQELRVDNRAQSIGAVQIKAVDNYMSSLSSAVQLADVGELEKAARLVRRSLTSAKKAGCIIDYTAIEARSRVLQREGYLAAVDRYLERIEKRAAKGEIAEVYAAITMMEECAVKAREFGGIIIIDTVRVEAAVAKAHQLGAVNAERDRIIADHLYKVGSAFLSLYEAATGDSSDGM